MNKLNPCPFCGNKFTTTKVVASGILVLCGDQRLCKARMGAYENLKNAIRFWNNRPEQFEKEMKLNEYQEKALETAIYPNPIIYPALGLTGEAGEVSDKVKKVLRDSGGVFTDEKKLEIAKEIGDVLWYCATMANDLGYDLETIAKMNYNKLKSRQDRGKIKGNGDNR